MSQLCFDHSDPFDSHYDLLPSPSSRTIRRKQARNSFASSSSFYLFLYFSLNLTLTLYNKAVLVRFPFPYTLTAVHALCGCIGAALVRRFRQKSGEQELAIGSKQKRLLAAFSVLYTVNIIVSNSSLHLVTVPFHQVVRATTPIFTIAFAFLLFKTPCSWKKSIPLIPVMLGVGFATYGDYHYTRTGLILTLFGTLLAALKTILTSVLQSPSSSPRLAPNASGPSLASNDAGNMKPSWLSARHRSNSSVSMTPRLTYKRVDTAFVFPQTKPPLAEPVCTEGDTSDSEYHGSETASSHSSESSPDLACFPTGIPRSPSLHIYNHSPIISAQSGNSSVLSKLWQLAFSCTSSDYLTISSTHVQSHPTINAVFDSSKAAFRRMSIRRHHKSLSHSNVHSINGFSSRLIAAIRQYFTLDGQTLKSHLSLSLTPLQILIHTSPLAVIQCLIYAQVTGELGRIWTFCVDMLAGSSPPSSGSTGVWSLTWIFLMLATNGATAFALNVISFAANKKAGALSMTVAANIKQVLTILLAVVIFDLTITTTNALGILLTFIGGAWYAVAEHRQKSSLI